MQSNFLASEMQLIFLLETTVHTLRYNPLDRHSQGGRATSKQPGRGLAVLFRRPLQATHSQHTLYNANVMQSIPTFIFIETRRTAG